MGHHGAAVDLLLGVRHGLHPVLLPVPDMADEEQVLQHLPDIQLGLYNDVHAAARGG